MATPLNIRGFNPIWSEVDLSGKQFDDTFWLYTLENTIPYIPQAVYHDPEGNVPWTDPIQFLANGTLPVDVYWLPNTVYRLEFRQNNGVDTPSQNDPLIYEVNNYVANGALTPTPPAVGANTSENEVANPQFAIVNFKTPTTIASTNPADLEIAPGWFLHLAGTGTAIMYQVPLDSSSPNDSNSPYMLRLTLSGWNSGEAWIYQRFQQNGMLWSGKTISSTVTGKVTATPASITASLWDSQGAPLGEILSAALTTSFVEYTGHSDPIIPPSTNTDVPPDAYIEYRLILPDNSDVFLSSIQILVQNPDDISEPGFVQDSVDRQIDHLFHYYEQPIFYKQIPSFLVGWDFPFNPAQFGVAGTALSSTIPATAIGANKSKYVWDQTIVFQSANSGVSVTRGTAGELLLTAAATTQMAIIQYLPPIDARKALNSPLCVNVSAKATSETVATVSLWYTTDVTLPVVATGTNNSIVLSLLTNGMVDTRNGSWTQVPRLIGNAEFTIGLNSTTNFNDYALSGWDMKGIPVCNTATFFAIVVGTAQVASTGTIGFNSVSLQAGTIPTRPAPKTIDQTLFECQYYYQKSFLYGVTPAQNLLLNSGESYGTLAYTASVQVVGIVVKYSTEMIKAPTVASYNIVGANGNIRNVTANDDLTTPVLTAQTKQGFILAGTTNVGWSNGQLLAVNWSADARLGVV